MEQQVIQIHPNDDVVVAVTPLSKGTAVTVGEQTVTVLQDIPFGHKLAICGKAVGESVCKYGAPIGHATVAIAVGDWVHTHNLKTNLDGKLAYQYQPNGEGSPPFTIQEDATFRGYRRLDGRVGIRNEVWIIPTVGCVNTTATRLAQQANQAFGDKIDGVFAYPHNMGCSQLGDDHKTTQKILKGLIEHPNAGAVLVLSLGCENNNLEDFLPVLGEVDPNRVKFLVTQEVEDEYEAGMALLQQLADYAAGFTREQVSAKHLTIGFKCGGSDGFSGITANALCGWANDRLVACGGSTILTEVPEMFGAETLLMARAVNQTVFDDVVSLVNNFKGYFQKYNQTIYENPSPGNKKGGISSLEDKSLGCTQKGGTAPVVGVLDYGQKPDQTGLFLLTGPGNDQVSCTNLTASGAQMILFTTGRGNPYGAPVPTVKISSNTPLYQRKPHWIDYNAGKLLDGQTMEQVGADFFQYLLAVASGETTKNEQYGYREISIFRDGVIL